MSESDFSSMTKAQLLEYLEGEPKNIHEAISALMGRVGYVQKEEGGGLGYSIASEPAFIRAVRPHMVDLGITVRQVDVEPIVNEQFETKKGATAFNRVFRFVWEWTHAPSGTSCLVTSIGEGTDYGDKAANKAMTGGLKYNLRQTLVIETGDDPDYTSSDEFERAKDLKAREMGLPSGNGRMENQWEQEIVDKAVEFELVQAKPHAINILNGSSLSKIPFGQLPLDVGLAYIIAWTKAKEADPDKSTDDRRVLVEKGWADAEARKRVVEQAQSLLGG